MATAGDNRDGLPMFRTEGGRLIFVRVFNALTLPISEFGLCSCGFLVYPP
jgi:hypothetical protein